MFVSNLYRVNFYFWLFWHRYGHLKKTNSWQINPISQEAACISVWPLNFGYWFYLIFNFGVQHLDCEELFLRRTTNHSSYNFISCHIYFNLLCPISIFTTGGYSAACWTQLLHHTVVVCRHGCVFNTMCYVTRFV